MLSLSPRVATVAVLSVVWARGIDSASAQDLEAFKNPPRRTNSSPEYRVPDRQIQHFIISRRSPWPVPSEGDPPSELNRFGRAVSLGIIGDQVFIESDMRIGPVPRVMARNILTQRLGAVVRITATDPGTTVLARHFGTSTTANVMSALNADLSAIGDAGLRERVRVELEAIVNRIAAQRGPAIFAVSTEIGRKWPAFPINYDDSAMNDTKKGEIKAAVEHWKEKTGLTFKHAPGATGDVIKFVGGSGCSSFVGHQGGEQEIVLSDGCSPGSVIHEIGHALGLHHEQSHPERDNFISIVWNKIKGGAENNFLRASNVGVATAYDYGSIMHYDTNAFSVDGSPTIIPKQQFAGDIGQRDGLSPRDIEGIKALYPECQPKCAE